MNWPPQQIFLQVLPGADVQGGVHAHLPQQSRHPAGGRQGEPHLGELVAVGEDGLGGVQIFDLALIHDQDAVRVPGHVLHGV